jgi:hypothetical protein
MLTNSLKELADAKAKVAELETAVSAELNAALRALPSQYGFDSMAAFISAVRAASGKRRGRKPGTAKAAAVKVAGKRKRAKITDAMRDEVKKLVEAGKTAKEIAKAVGISQPSVANIKKALGLVGKKKG